MCGRNILEPITYNITGFSVILYLRGSVEWVLRGWGWVCARWEGYMGCDDMRSEGKLG